MDLGTFGGTTSYAMDINNAGQVVGLARVPSGDFHAFIWDASTGMQDLGTFGGRHSAAYAINENGVVVGEATNSSGDARAFTWTSASGMQDLGTLTQGQYSRAYGINDQGAVVGASVVGPGCCVEHAFVWTPEGGMQDLGTLGGDYSQAWAVNNAGTVIGLIMSAERPSVPTSFIWNSTMGMVDLGSLGWPGVWATAINQAGYVTGQAYVAPNGPAVAFLKAPDAQMQPVLGINTAGRGLNSQLQIVGESWRPPQGGMHAYLLDPEVGEVWLPEAGVDSQAYAINDTGTVVGWISFPDGSQHAAVWDTKRLFDSVSVSLTDGFAYSTSGAVQSGDVRVLRTSRGAVAGVTGSGQVNSATVTFSVRQFWVLPVMVGSVSISDPSAAIGLNTPVVFTRVTTDQTGTVGGIQRWVDFSRFPWKPYTLTWTVNDRV